MIPFHVECVISRKRFILRRPDFRPMLWYAKLDVGIERASPA